MLGVYCCYFFFFKQKTAYEMRISDWSSDVCSSDLASGPGERLDAPDVEPLKRLTHEAEILADRRLRGIQHLHKLSEREQAVGGVEQMVSHDDHPLSPPQAPRTTFTLGLRLCAVPTLACSPHGSRVCPRPFPVQVLTT